MKLLRNLSIRNKIILIILSIAVLSLGSGFAIIILKEIRSFRREMIDNTVVIARVIGDYSVIDLAFYDKEESIKTLAKLATISNIQYAFVYDSNGKLFSAYDRSGKAPQAPSVPPPANRFEGRFLHVSQPIQEKSQKYGTIYLVADTAPLNAKIRDYLLTMLVLMTALVVAAVILAVRFQAFISGPILALADAAKTISERGDYSIRVQKSGEDEIGTLCEGFNNMLNQIELRQSERNKAEEALKQSEKRFRQIVEQSNDAMYVLIGRKFVFINPKFEEYLGYSLSETNAPDFDSIKLASPESQVLLLERAEKRQRGEPIPNRYIFRAISKSGVAYDFEANVGEIEWDGVPALLGVLRDVTERLKAEETLRQQQEQVQRYAQELERSNRELDQFAYITSHDLKAPLQAISNLSEWIEEDLSDHLTDESRKHLNLLRRRVQRMVALIEGILEFSRVRRVHQKPETVDVARLLAEVVDMMERPPGFAIVIAQKMPFLETERVRLEQVFTNLIGNAIKHHDKPAGKIEVDWREKDGFYEFSVKDDGPGIAPEYHEKVFVIFQTLKARDKFESTGVGLALVKRIVEDKGGVVTVESQQGKGATFRFTWPKKML